MTLVFEGNFPELDQRHLQDAKLFSNRIEMLHALATIPRMGSIEDIVEVGVAFGNGSEALINAFHPRIFHAVDTFRLHELEEMWGQPTAAVFNGLTHAEYYASRIRPLVTTLDLRIGDSADVISTLSPKSADVIYIDGDHSERGTGRDADAAIGVIKDDGLLIFNDYTWLDPVSKDLYGVVPVVNRLVVERGWFVVAFAFQKFLFCDIAIHRMPAGIFWGGKGTGF